MNPNLSSLKHKLLPLGASVGQEIRPCEATSSTRVSLRCSHVGVQRGEDFSSSLTWSWAGLSRSLDPRIRASILTGCWLEACLPWERRGSRQSSSQRGLWLQCEQERASEPESVSVHPSPLYPIPWNSPTKSSPHPREGRTQGKE